jgi:hypothetical protein
MKMIIGMNFTSINAYTKDQPTKQVKVHSAPRRVDIEEYKIIEMSDVVRVKFTFVCEYTPDVGKVNIEGQVLWKDASTKDILARWEADKKLEGKIAAPILNTIFRRCVTKTVELADELRLPPPVQFPVVVEGKDPREKPAKKATAS